MDSAPADTENAMTMPQLKAELAVGHSKAYHLSQDHYVVAPYFLTIKLGSRNVNITSQKLSCNHY